MNNDIQKENMKCEYIMRHMCNVILKAVISFFYWIEKLIEHSHKKKKYKNLLLGYTMFFIISTIIVAFIVHNFIIVGFYIFNNSVNYNLEKRKYITSFIKILMLCGVIMLSCILQNVFSKNYNPVQKIRLLIQAMIYKFDIKKTFVMFVINISTFGVLYRLIIQAFDSYIKYFNLSDILLDQIDVFEILMSFIIFYYIYVWAVEDSIIRTKRRLFLFILSSIYLIVNTVSSVYDLLIKSGYHQYDFNYTKFVIFIIALLVSVDKVFDSMKALEKVYSDTLEKEKIKSDLYSRNVYREIFKYKKYVKELLCNTKKIIFNEYREMKKYFFLFNSQQRIKKINFIVTYIIIVLLFLFIASKLELLVGNNSIYFKDKLHKIINLRDYNIYSYIYKAFIYILCIGITLIICIGSIKSVCMSIISFSHNINFANLYIKGELLDLEKNFITAIFSIIMLIVFISNWLNINIRIFIKYFIYCTLYPSIMIFIINLICKTISDRIDEYKK